VLQARAAIDFLVKAGWQHIVLITSTDNCGLNISKEFYNIVNSRECNFKRVHYFEENPHQVVHILGELNPTDISVNIGIYNKFQSIIRLTTPETIIVLLSSIPFSYNLLKLGFYNSQLTPEQRKNFTFLLGDFWGEPGEAEDLYELVKDLARDTAQVVSLRSHLNGYEKFQHHMANLRSSSPELQRNKFLGDYWSDYFNCRIGVNCSGNLTLPTVNRPILQNKAAVLVIDAVYAIVAYIQQFYDSFPLRINGSVSFSKSIREQTITSWTGNTFHLASTHPLSYIEVVEWKYDILILKLADDGQLDVEQYGQWVMHKERPDNLTVNNSVKWKLWRPKQFFDTLDLCPTPPTPAFVGDKDEVCSSKDVQSLVALPVIMLVILCVMGLTYGMTKGWISAQESILEISCFLLVLVLVTAAAILVSILIATDIVSALSCDSLVADFLVNVIGCICYVTILVAVLASGIGGKLKYFRVKMVVFFILFTVQVIISSVASFGNDDKQGNKSDDEYCVYKRDRPIVSLSYWYNAVIVLVAAFLFLVTFRRMVSQKAPQPSCAAPVLGLLLALLYTILISLFVWSEEYCGQIRLLVVLAAYPAIIGACMLSRAALSQCCRKASKRRTSIELPEGLNGNEPLQRARSHHYIDSSHVDNQVFTIPGDFWEEDLVKEINEVLVEPNRVKVSAKIGKG
jgi:hypothetical protein